MFRKYHQHLAKGQKGTNFRLEDKFVLGVAMYSMVAPVTIHRMVCLRLLKAPGSPVGNALYSQRHRSDAWLVN